MIDQRAKSIRGIVQWFRDGAACSPDGIRFSPATLLAMAETLDDHDRTKQRERRAGDAGTGERFANDEAAKALYESWSDQPGWVPWVERGNSEMQERARREVKL